MTPFDSKIKDDEQRRKFESWQREMEVAYEQLCLKEGYTRPYEELEPKGLSEAEEMGRDDYRQRWRDSR